MSKYPYILNTGKLKKFLENIPKIGVPPKINTNTLPTLGFKSNADRPIVKILKFIQFTDHGGVPTKAYRAFRDSSKAGSVMGSALKAVYSDLFEIYPNAHETDDKSLKDFFASTTDAGAQVIDRTVDTFRILCSFADFKVPPVEPALTPTPSPTAGRVQLPITPEGVRLDVSIRIELPVTQDADVYDKIFKSLKRHLLSPSSEED